MKSYNGWFIYDHTGLRVKRSVNGVDTLYALHGMKTPHIRKWVDSAGGSNAVQMHSFDDAQGRPRLVR